VSVDAHRRLGDHRHSESEAGFERVEARIDQATDEVRQFCYLMKITVMDVTCSRNALRAECCVCIDLNRLKFKRTGA
jgi:hypothetical protein